MPPSFPLIPGVEVPLPGPLPPIISTILGAQATYLGIKNLRLGPFRPPQWSHAAPVMITAKAQGGDLVHIPPPATNQTTDAFGNVVDPSAPDAYVYSIGNKDTTNATRVVSYVFDAVLSIEHEQRLEKTLHPVQTGAAISSHAFLLPARVTMQVGMSDAMASFATSGNRKQNRDNPVEPFKQVDAYGGQHANSKSVNAYQTMLQLQSQRQLLTVTTRLRTYQNMLITSISPHEDNRTLTGLRMRIEFEEIYTASITTALSARNHETDSTSMADQGTTTPDPATQKQFQIPEVPQQQMSLPGVPLPGNWSSEPVQNLKTMPGFEGYGGGAFGGGGAGGDWDTPVPPKPPRKPPKNRKRLPR